jgi:hypothetical protein
MRKLHFCNYGLIEKETSWSRFLRNIFDISWKYNSKNYELAVKYSKNPSEVTQSSREIAVLVILLCLILIAGLVTLTILFWNWIFKLLASFSWAA